MRNLYIILSFVCSVIAVNAQDNLNLELVSHTTIPESGSDIWGWVDSTGTEYAIMGGNANTWIYSLADPANPQVIKQIPGVSSIWRDIKSWEDHIYVTTDTGNDGLLVIDMSMAPDSVAYQYIRPQVIASGDTSILNKCHNLYIDENGFCYLAGCSNPSADKAIILDLNQDKWNPPIVGAHGLIFGGGAYAHDVYVKNNILYASEIYQGQLGIYDCTRKDSLILLGTQATVRDFTHNAWTSTDQNYVFTTDERANAFVEAFDISDPKDIKFLDRYQPLETVNQGVIPHNTHYYDGYLVTSYYTDGVVVTDVSKPDNMIKVGAYDTYLGPHGGFSGCWGAYPYLPSGLLLASDINSGLYVFNPNYVRAARLEGRVTDKESGDVINNAEIRIVSDQLAFDFSQADGQYKTGIAEQGQFAVTATHPDYKVYSADVDLVNGEVTIHDIQMEKIQIVNVNVKVISSENGEVIPDAKVSFNNTASNSYEFDTDNFGEVSSSIEARTYALSAGAWGYISKTIDIDTENEQDFVIELDRGYADNFVLDLGWEVTGTAISGQWERAIPQGTAFDGSQMAPAEDSPNDEDAYAYVSGNDPGNGAGDNDIDDGYIQLKSPFMDLFEMVDPQVSFDYWFVNAGGNGPVDDTLVFFIHENGDSLEIGRIDMNTEVWERFELNLADFIETGDSIQISAFTQDLNLTGHLLEVGFDNFKVEDMNISSISDVAQVEIKAYPNPFTRTINIETEDSGRKQLLIYNQLGQKVKEFNFSSQSIELTLDIIPGVYWMHYENEAGEINIQKLIKN